MVVNPLIVLQGLLIYGLFCWKLAHLARAPRDVPLRWVVACLACSAAAYPAELLFVPHEASPESRWFMIAQCSFLLGAIYSLNGFFLSSLLPAPEARQRAVRRGGLLIAAVILIAVTAGTVPASAAMVDESVPQVAAAYLIFNTAIALLLADSLRWTLRGIGDAARHVAGGLRLASAGTLLMLAGLVPLIAVLVIRGTGGTQSPHALSSWGQLLVLLGALVFLAGLLYPSAAVRLGVMRRWSRHRRRYRQLGPLWSALHDAFPEDALTRAPVSRWRDAISPWGVHRRYYRRVIECRDGLVRISPHLPQPRIGDTATLGDRLVTTLRTVDAGQLSQRQAVPVAMPESGGLDADADELARLSRQIAAQRTQARRQ